MATRKPPKPVVKVGYGSCVMFSSWLMRCPLCHVEVPANTQHQCSNPPKETK